MYYPRFCGEIFVIYVIKHFLRDTQIDSTL